MTVDDWFCFLYSCSWLLLCLCQRFCAACDVVGNVYLIILKSNDQLSLSHFSYVVNWTTLCSFFWFFVLFSCFDCTLIWYRKLLWKVLFRTVGQFRWILFHQRSCWTVVVLLFLVVVSLCLVDGLVVHLCKRSSYMVCGNACTFHLWGWKWCQDNLLHFCCILLLFHDHTFQNMIGNSFLYNENLEIALFKGNNILNRRTELISKWTNTLSCGTIPKTKLN